MISQEDEKRKINFFYVSKFFPRWFFLHIHTHTHTLPHTHTHTKYAVRTLFCTCAGTWSKNKWKFMSFKCIIQTHYFPMKMRAKNVECDLNEQNIH